MDAIEKYRKACEQFGSLQNPNPPMRVDWLPSVVWKLLFDSDRIPGEYCLVYLHVENGIGIADRGQRGYTPTLCSIGEGVKGPEAVDWFNREILELSEKESFQIVLSTMRS